MKTNILIHIGSLNTGGAEKSLTSLLNLLPNDAYSVDLLLLKNEGVFKNLLPDGINVLSVEFPYECLTVSPKDLAYYLSHNPKFFFKKIYSLLKLYLKKDMSQDQILWQIWRNDIRVMRKEYDVAISYIEGLPNYYVIDKVNAKRKLLWVHNEYTKLNYNKDFDFAYFNAADAVVTISELCKKDLAFNFPSLDKKFCVLENITNPEIVRRMSKQEIIDEKFDCHFDGLRILSIGRLHSQKNYDLAIDAAKVIKDRGVDFKWYIIGEGPLYDSLNNKIKSLGLNDRIILLGIRSNPYAYMKRCDIIVQSSLYEGKSIVIDEAKILYKPIVATNYNTVYNVITDHVNGLICEMNQESLANCILELYHNTGLREHLIHSLKAEDVNNVDEIRNYIGLINGNNC